MLCGLILFTAFVRLAKLFSELTMLDCDNTALQKIGISHRVAMNSMYQTSFVPTVPFAVNSQEESICASRHTL